MYSQHVPTQVDLSPSLSLTGNINSQSQPELKSGTPSSASAAAFVQLQGLESAQASASQDTSLTIAKRLRPNSFKDTLDEATSLTRSICMLTYVEYTLKQVSAGSGIGSAVSQNDIDVSIIN